ncbi:MAG TPA: cupin domain-containing protein [Clostridia bacterium]|nr:cupin domain-containing protein [Clostridiaceae bacterium]HXK71575.1 cupin domain-containing protein [Clostridia bacterium]
MSEERLYMLFKKEEQKVSYKENMRGGQGTIMFNELLPEKMLNNKGRLFSTITIEKGCSIGFHVHEKEAEIFYVIEGSLTYNQNNEKKYIISKGDCIYNKEGTGHGVINESDEKAVLLACILFV